MNLQIIATQDFRQEYINVKLYESLCHEFKDRGTITVVDKNPDIVHLFGLWDDESMKVVHGFNARKIPVVFTSINGLIALNASGNSFSQQNSINRYVKKISQKVAKVHVCGTVEGNAVHGLCKDSDTHCIKNCYYTNLISKHEMLHDFENMYVSIVEKHDDNVRQLISNQIKDANLSDNAIALIISKMQYLQYLQIKGSIPKAYIDELSEIFTETDYNEQHLCNILHKLKLYKFTSRAMQMLSECSTLTEGFMPMPPTDDKATDALKQCILH